jgi:hypothetical protein
MQLIGEESACRKMTSEEVPINWRSSLMRSFPTCRHISRESSMKRIQEQAVHHQGIEHFCDHLFNQWKQLSEDEKKKGRETRLQTSQHSSSTVARVTVPTPCFHLQVNRNMSQILKKNF